MGRQCRARLQPGVASVERGAVGGRVARIDGGAPERGYQRRDGRGGRGMTFSIPILIEERTTSEQMPPTFVVRPLFVSTPTQSSDRLGRALNKLTSDLLQVLRELGREPRHDELARWTFHPDLEETTVELRLELASGSQAGRFFLVGYEALDRKIFFTPTLPELHFEVSAEQDLKERATAVLTQHFRQMEKEDGPVSLDAYALRGRPRLSTIDLALDPAALAKKPKPPT